VGIFVGLVIVGIRYGKTIIDIEIFQFSLLWSTKILLFR